MTTVICGAEGWTLRQEEKKKIQAAEMWFYRILINVTWRQRRTNESILEELKVKRELFGNIVKRKLSFFGHQIRSKNSRLVSDITQARENRRKKREGKTKDKLHG